MRNGGENCIKMSNFFFKKILTTTGDSISLISFLTFTVETSFSVHAMLYSYNCVWVWSRNPWGSHSLILVQVRPSPLKPVIYKMDLSTSHCSLFGCTCVHVSPWRLRSFPVSPPETKASQAKRPTASFFSVLT